MVRGSAQPFEPTPVHTDALFGQHLREPAVKFWIAPLAVAQANSVAIASL